MVVSTSITKTVDVEGSQTSGCGVAADLTQYDSLRDSPPKKSYLFKKQIKGTVWES